MLAPNEHAQTPESVGRPLKGAKVRVVANNGEEAPPNELGEIRVKSPLLSLGCQERSRETATGLAHGCFRTGDLGYLDEDGFLHVVDRVKDVIIRGGEKVYPAEVEKVLRGHPSVRDVAVARRSHPDLGEEVSAFVELHEGHLPDEQALHRVCAENLARFKLPSRIDFMSELPRNVAGNTLKRRLIGNVPAEQP